MECVAVIGEEWHWLLDSPTLPTFLYPSAAGFTLPQPFWFLREGDEIVTVAWSQSGVVQSILRGCVVNVLVSWPNDDLVMLLHGEATIAADPAQAEAWARRLWIKFRGEGHVGYSPARCDTVIRFAPSGGFQTSTEQISHTRTVFVEDSGSVLESKLLYNLNQMLKDQRLPAISNLDEVELIHSKDMDPVAPRCTSLRVPRSSLVPRSGRGDFLRKIFIPGFSCPSWINIMTFLQDGRPQLLRFNAQDPPQISDLRFGGTMMMSYRSDLAIEFV